MLEGTYEAVVDTPLGQQHATLTLEPLDDGQLSATLSAPAFGSTTFDGTYSKNTFQLTGSVRVLIKRFDFTADGRVKGDALHLDITSNGKKMQVDANRV